jgi:hypothetical protein
VSADEDDESNEHDKKHRKNHIGMLKVEDYVLQLRQRLLRHITNFVSLRLNVEGDNTISGLCPLRTGEMTDVGPALVDLNFFHRCEECLRVEEQHFQYLP